MNNYSTSVACCQRHDYTELLWIVQEGYPVMPVRADGKQPVTRHGVKDASTDVDRLFDWVCAFPAANWAVAGGGERRLLMIDVDGPRGHAHDGRAAWQSMGIRTRGPWHATPSGGARFWFETPAGAQIGNGDGVIAPGIDHKTVGGYGLIPPSVLRSGPYAWEVAPWRAPLPPLPAVLADRLLAPPVADVAPMLVAADVAELAERVARAQVGTRNATLNRAAYLIGRMIAAGQTDRATAEAALSEAARVAGLSPREVRATLRSGLDAGLRAGPWSSEAARVASSVRSWVSGQPWVGRAGPTDKAVLIAHCTLAERAAREVYAADVRTLAELAGVSKSAVSLANGRLVAAGYLTLVAPSETVKGLAARYELRLKWTVNQDTDSLTSSRAAESEVARGSTLEARAAALWARAALGPIAGEVYRALQTGAQTLPALIAATGRGRRSVQRALSVLAAHGLAVRVGRVWSVGAADPATVAETTAANARAALRSAWHEREREAWREAQR